jgi:hypothetical protein
MQHLLDHARSFPNHVAQQRDQFDQLAHGQSPQVLFLTRTVLAYRAHADEFLPL